MMMHTETQPLQSTYFVPRTQNIEYENSCSLFKVVQN